MIESYTEEGKTFYKVRVWVRSQMNPNIRSSRQSAGLKSEQEALREETRLTRECEQLISERERKGILWGDLVTKWYDHQLNTKVAAGRNSQTTLDDALGTLNKWLGDFQNRSAADLNSFVMESLFQRLGEKNICLGHQKKIKQTIKGVFDFGIKSGILTGVVRSPTFDVVLKKTIDKKPEILTLSEMKTLIEKGFEEGHPWRHIWAFAMMTGMRSGELYALKWKSVSLETKLISVTEAYNPRKKLVTPTKGSYWRDVPISSELEKLLKELKGVTGDTEYVLPRFWQWQKGLQARVLRLFCFLHKLPSIKFHTLRACFATQLLRQGVEAAKVMKICGWKDLKTMQHYIRLAGIEIQGVTEPLKLIEGLSFISVQLTGRTKEGSNPESNQTQPAKAA